MRFGTIIDPATETAAFAQSADPEDMQSRVNAILADIFAAEPARAVTAISLGGGGDGHTFVTVVQSAETTDVVGGITDPGSSVVCYMGADSKELAVQRAALPPTASFVADEQIAGGAKGTRFMVLITLTNDQVVPSGPTGSTGGAGPAGPTGSTGVTAFGSFFALMPGDNAATIAVGAAVLFPQDGPAAGGIVRSSSSQFVLPAIGTYRVTWQVSVDEAGQLMLDLDSGGGPAILAATVAGRATGTSQIMNDVIITTTAVNSVLRVINPAGNAAALTITPSAGGTHAVSAWLSIQRLS